ncbi:potassium channel family protein [Ruegeria atlantica]|jgi:voltage-gated potassium channel Kch|uniref:Voltage-gated potassium channel n=1 Tax=Ruegeria atlantica TaxID=81569 RepID=A0A0P1EAZ7_9RHOB|nr:potassium channel family protein [Ruegeria atlantica]CUH45877.1 voltage-gated potassium channel [Ruegeria atlantica]
MVSFWLNFLRLIKGIIRSWDDHTFRAALFLAALLLASGTIFYSQVEGWTLIDSLYFSATTISTVGLGDLTPQTDFGKLFTVIYMFVGIGVFVAVFSRFTKALLNIEHVEQLK